MENFNYKTVYFFTLSISGILFLLGISGNIKIEHSGTVMVDSILIMIYSIIVWIIDYNIDTKIGIEINDWGVTSINPTLYRKFSKEKVGTLIGLIIVIIATLLFSLLFTMI